MKYFLVILIVMFIFSSLSFPYVYATQLTAYLNPGNSSSNFEIIYLRTVTIEYGEGGQIADSLKGKQWMLETSISTPDRDAMTLMNTINNNIAYDRSAARIVDLDVYYSATLTGRDTVASIDYKIVLTGNISNYTISEYSPDNPSLIDMEWRGMTVNSPVVINGIEINLPLSAIIEKEPEVYKQFTSEFQVERLLSRPLIDAGGIRNESLTNWHFLYDPTGINIEPSNFGLSEKISGFGVSSYTLGTDIFRRTAEQELIEFTKEDHKYAIKSIESQDMAVVGVIGFAVVDELEGIEVIGVTPQPPIYYDVTSGDNYPIAFLFSIIGVGLFGCAGLIIYLWKKGTFFT